MRLINPKIGTHATDANLEYEPARHGATLVLTHNLTANRTIGINGSGYEIGARVRIVRNSAAPAAFTAIIKSGTVAAGATIATLVASKNGFVECQWDGAAWVNVGQAAAS